MGWAANPTRKVEGLFTVAIVQLGARIYFPTLERFASVDPVPGGNANSYVYVLDPVNQDDYSGKCWNPFGWFCAKSAPAKKRNAGSATKPVPQPIFKQNYPLTPDGHIDFKHLAKPAPLGPPIKQGGYTNASLGGGLIIGGSFNMVQSNDGTTTLQSVSKGFTFPRGIGGSITYGPGTPTSGCTVDISVFFIIGGTLSFGGGGVSPQVGVGTPGVSLMQTCTY